MIAIQNELTSASPAKQAELSLLVEQLEKWFDGHFLVCDEATGELLYQTDSSHSRGATPRLQPPPILPPHHDPVSVHKYDALGQLVIAIEGECASRYGVVVTFAAGHVQAHEDLSVYAERLGLSRDDAAEWINSQPLWNAEGLRRLAEGFLAARYSELRVQRLEQELTKANAVTEDVSDALVSSYEEISLLYSFVDGAENKKSGDELLATLLDWSIDVLPCEAVVIQLVTMEQKYPQPSEFEFKRTLVRGDCPLGGQQLEDVFRKLGPRAMVAPLVVNDEVTQTDDWEFPDIRQIVLVPLTTGGDINGWITAINHERENGWFGSVQINLLQCVSRLLGIYQDNLTLTQRQYEMLLEKSDREREIASLKQEVTKLDEVVQHSTIELTRVYEEISLLQRLAKQLPESFGQDKLMELAIDWMFTVLPVQSFGVCHLTSPGSGDELPWTLCHTRGEQVIDHSQFNKLVEDLQLIDRDQPLVINPPVTTDATWRFPDVQQFLLVPMRRDASMSAWIFAINHTGGIQLGTQEAGLIASATAMVSLVQR